MLGHPRRDLHFHGVVMSGDLTSTAPVLGVGVGTAAVMAVQAGAEIMSALRRRLSHIG